MNVILSCDKNLSVGETSTSPLLFVPANAVDDDDDDDDFFRTGRSSLSLFGDLVGIVVDDDDDDMFTPVGSSSIIGIVKL